MFCRKTIPFKNFIRESSALNMRLRMQPRSASVEKMSVFFTTYL